MKTPMAMPLANRVPPRQPAQQHGRVRCIEQRRTSGESVVADSCVPCRWHERRPSVKTPLRVQMRHPLI